MRGRGRGALRAAGDAAELVADNSMRVVLVSAMVMFAGIMSELEWIANVGALIMCALIAACIITIPFAGKGR